MSTATRLRWSAATAFPGFPTDGSEHATLPDGRDVSVNLLAFGDPTSGWVITVFHDAGPAYLGADGQATTFGTKAEAKAHLEGVIR